MRLLSTLLLFLIAPAVRAKDLTDEFVVTVAAAMVEMAQASEGISHDEDWLLGTQFPIKGNPSPVLVFTLDRSNLPQSLANLNLDQQKSKQVLAFLALVAISDNHLQEEEKALFLRYQELQNDSPPFDDTIKIARKIQLKLRHKKIKEDLRELAEKVIEFHQENGYYPAAELYPSLDSQRPYRWNEEESGNFQLLDWKPKGSNFGCYKIETSENSFVATVVIDSDNDGVFATYTATHKNSESIRKTPKEIR